MSDNTAIFLIVLTKLLATVLLFIGTGYAVFVLDYSGWWFALTILLTAFLPGLERVERKNG